MGAPMVGQSRCLPEEGLGSVAVCLCASRGWIEAGPVAAPQLVQPLCNVFRMARTTRVGAPGGVPRISERNRMLRSILTRILDFVT
jgi:hypothetical protein